MAYDYDVDILATLWTGAEDGEAPYASIIAANPTLTDEVSESRILSSIELVRSHIELLSSREEANLLHYAISRLIRHAAGGSDPFSAAASITSAQGNVNNPVFPAGASFDIVIDGVTSSPASATGGNCQTVVAELNATLDALIPGDVELTNVDLAGADAVTLSGKYFTINSASDATSYYAWFNKSVANSERTTVTPVAGDTGGSLGGKYFTVNSAGDATSYYAWLDHPGLGESVSLDFTSAPASGYPTGAVAAAWFDVTSTTATYRFWFSDGATTPPAVTTETLIAIPFTGAEAAIATAALVVTALVTTSADADFASIVNGGTPIVTGTLVTAGDVTDPVDGAIATGATIASTTQGIAPATDPVGPGTSLPITYAIGDGVLTLATKIGSAITANLDFTASDAGGVTTINTVGTGVTTDSADVDTGFTIATTQQGAPASTDPAPGGLTAIPIAVSAGDADTEIRSTTSTAFSLHGDFSSEFGVGTSINISNIVAGDTTDAADVDTALPITVTTQGTDSVGDAVGVQAFCVQPGNRIGIRAQVPFLTFEINNGSGGIVGPAGMVPGERSSTPKRVSDEGRNAAVGNYVGKRGGTVPS
jgi:hypothetical protein